MLSNEGVEKLQDFLQKQIHQCCKDLEFYEGFYSEFNSILETNKISQPNTGEEA